MIASPDNPSVAPTIRAATDRFREAVRAEQRFFGRRSPTGPKPLPSLIRRLIHADPAVRVVAVAGDEVVGMTTIELAAPAGPELLLAVAEPWRGRGVATELTRAVLVAARERDVPRLVVRTSRRVPALIALGRAMGAVVTEGDRGRIDLILELAPGARSA